MVNLTGASSGKAVGEVQDAELDMLLDRQVRPLHRLMRAVLPQMLARRKGKIVVVGSATGLRGQPRRAAYSAAAGAAATAAFLQGAAAYRDRKVALLVTGANISLEVLRRAVNYS